MVKVTILNKDGSIWLCGDYKVTVNRETVTETYPLLHVEDLLASLSGDTTFMKFNLTHAYQRVVLNDEAKQLTTINTHKGLYHCKQTPFWCGLGSLFQRIMENLLPGWMVIGNKMVWTKLKSQ